MEIGNRVKLKNNTTDKIFTIIEIYTDKNTSPETKKFIGDVRIESGHGSNKITHTVSKAQLNLVD